MIFDIINKIIQNRLLIIFSILAISACATTSKINKISTSGKVIITKHKSPINDDENSNEFTIVLGKLKNQFYIPDVLPVECFNDNVICMDAYYMNEIQIKEVLSGEFLSGFVQAVRLQHSKYYYKGDDLNVFILSKIKNLKSQKLLNTKYYLEENISPRTQYCFPKPLNDYIKKPIEEINSNCLEESFVLTGYKELQIKSVISDIESQLNSEGLLMNILNEYSDGEEIYEDESEEELDEINKNCPTEFNLDKLDDNPECPTYENTYEVVKFSLKKGKAEVVKKRIKLLIEQSKIELSNIQMNFIIREKRDMSILEWHYRVNHLTKL